jgi:hypothetical protein
MNYPDPETEPLVCDLFEGYDPCAICRRDETSDVDFVTFACDVWDGCHYCAWYGLTTCMDCLIWNRDPAIGPIWTWYAAALPAWEPEGVMA